MLWKRSECGQVSAGVQGGDGSGTVVSPQGCLWAGGSALGHPELSPEPFLHTLAQDPSCQQHTEREIGRGWDGKDMAGLSPAPGSLEVDEHVDGQTDGT